MTTILITSIHRQRVVGKRFLLTMLFCLALTSRLQAEPLPEEVKNSIGMRLRRVPAGKFQMGSPPDEPGRQEREKLHDVAISRDFYIGVFEVTQGDYRAVMGSNPSHFGQEQRKRGEVDAERFDRYPVDSVSWNDARDFCAKLSKLEAERSADRTYRLPTEAEWEYACRAGSNAAWSFGSAKGELSKHAWSRHRRSELTTHAVGEKEPNAWGLFDMHGNVWEWCEDWYAENSHEDAAAIDPAGPKGGSSKVIRGGSYMSVPAHTRSATRFHDPPSIGDADVGFRVVMIPVEK